ncbi:hypothetical protein [Yinghuangia soli]|uniref:hypothetical protein n=1 Tax=Yinghuangia soli TaxID=2908204 RepID=UPI0035586036
MRLRHSDIHTPGIRRLRHGRGFRYVDRGGRPLGADERDRIKAPAIPPAWSDARRGSSTSACSASATRVTPGTTPRTA